MSDELSDEELHARVERVRKAMLDDGVNSPYHRRQVEHLRQKWPTLYNAIMELVNNESGRNHKAKG